MPEQRQHVPYDRVFTAEQFERIKLGFIPKEMEDKWFVFFEGDWLYLHRSWTGHCIFQMRLEQAGGEWRVGEAWANRDESQYRSTKVEEDVKQLEDVLRWCFQV